MDAAVRLSVGGAVAKVRAWGIAVVGDGDPFAVCAAV